MQSSTDQISDSSRQLAAVGYIPLANVAMAIVYRKEGYVFFHSLQGVILSLYFFLSYFLIPNFGTYLALAFIALATAGFIQTAAGQSFRIPLLASFLDAVVKIFDKSRVDQ